MVPADRPRSDENVVVETERDEGESIVRTVTRALAATRNVPETELGPLYHRINTGALHSLVTHAERADRGVTVRFGVGDQRVLIEDDRVTVLAIDESQPPEQ